MFVCLLFSFFVLFCSCLSSSLLLHSFSSLFILSLLSSFSFSSFFSYSSLSLLSLCVRYIVFFFKPFSFSNFNRQRINKWHKTHQADSLQTKGDLIYEKINNNNNNSNNQSMVQWFLFLPPFLLRLLRNCRNFREKRKVFFLLLLLLSLSFFFFFFFLFLFSS